MSRDQPGLLSSAVVAEIVHNALAAYDAALQTASPPRWADAPKWMKQSALEAVERFRRDASDGPEREHQSWMAAKIADGWKYGPGKDAKRKTHPMLLDYAQLPESVRTRDRLLVAIVQTLTSTS